MRVFGFLDRRDEPISCAVGVDHQHAKRLGRCGGEAVAPPEALELVREDPEVAAGRPEGGELTLLDPLLDGRGRDLQHLADPAGGEVSLRRFFLFVPFLRGPTL
jgi:hypothetical protein